MRFYYVKLLFLIPFVLIFLIYKNQEKITYSSWESTLRVDGVITKLHNDEYCIGYNFLTATETFREDLLEPVTLVTHGTSDLLAKLEMKSSYWDGPISFGLFIDLHSSDALKYLADMHRCNVEFQRKVTVHIAFRVSAFQTSCPIVTVAPSNVSCESFLKNRSEMRMNIISPFLLYPYNLMRNIARIGAQSDLHFMTDGDMMPSDGFATSVKRIANEVLDEGLKANTEFHDQQIIMNYKKLLQTRRFQKTPTGNSILFRVFEFHHKFFFVGHQIQNLTQWFDISQKSENVSSWEIPYSSCVWEPQPILHRNDPYNKEYFPARIKDMTSLIYNLCRANYTFHLLSHVFDVQEGIKYSDTTFSKSVIAHQKKFARNKAYKRYVKELDELYPDTLKKCGNFIM